MQFLGKSLVVVGLSLLLASCGDDGESGAPTTAVQPLTASELLAPGPYKVGVTTLSLEDTSRPTMANNSYPGAATRTLVTEVWYPTTSAPLPGEPEVRDAPLASAGRPYPLILYSHGFISNRYGGAFLTRHLASHGYVVMAADYPLTNAMAPGGPAIFDLANQPRDVSFLIDSMLTLAANSTSRFAGAIDPTRIGLTGLSLGGSTTLLATFHPTLRDPRVKAAAVLAAGACDFGARFYGDRRIPIMLVHGDIDAIVPYEANALLPFALINPPKYLVTLSKGSHTGFTDGIELLAENGNNPDDIGCSALGGVGETADPEAEARFRAALGGAEAGILDNASCPASCPTRRNPRSMRPSRQLQLTILSVFPFFEAELHGNAAARAYVEQVLGAENADVTVVQGK